MQQHETGAAAMERVMDETVAAEHLSPLPDNNEKRDQNSDSGSTLSGKEHALKVPVATDEDALYAHLPEHEKEILKRQLDAPTVKISFFGLYRYASKMDILILIVSAICAIAAGAALPLFTVSTNACLVSLRFSSPA